MRLYVDSQYISPYAMSVFVALKVKQLPFDMLTVDLGAAANRHPKYAATSLTQRVPTLVDGELMLSESSAITEYLHEAYPGPALYPTDLTARAHARQIQAWLRSDLMPIRQERSAEFLFYPAEQQPLSADAQAAAKKLFFVAETLLNHSRENLFDAWCIADTDLSLMLNRLLLNGDVVPRRLANYAAYQWRHPAVQQWVAQTRPSLVID